METIVAFAPKISSGIDVIDEAWGGLYGGGSYLIFGRAVTGRGLLTMTFAKTGAQLGERCLFISPDRPKDLMIQAASLGFDLREAHESGTVRLMRIPPMLNLDDVGDDRITSSLGDLISIVRQNRPERLVINDFMPFVQFQSFDRFREAFTQMLEQIDSLDTTIALVMSEPINQQSRSVIEYMRKQMTGAVHIELAGRDMESTKRRLTLLPNIGHITRHVVDYWDLQEVVVESERPASARYRRMLPGPAPAEQEDPAREPQRRYRFALDAQPGVDSPAATDERSAPVLTSNYSSSHALKADVIEYDNGLRSYRLGRPSAEPRSGSGHRSPAGDGTERIQPIPLGRTRGEHESRREEVERPARTAQAAAPAHVPNTASDQKPAPAPIRMEPGRARKSGTTQTRQAYRDEPVYRRPSAHDLEAVSRGSSAQPGEAVESQSSEEVEEGGASGMPEVRRAPDKPEVRRAPDEREVHRAPDKAEVHRAPDKAEVRLAPDMTAVRDVPEEPITAGSSVSRISHTDRDGFRSRLQQHFLRRDVNGTPFVLIAMRMDRRDEQTARPFDFEFILDLVTELLRTEDDLVVDLDRERLIVLLAESNQDDAREFFIRLKNRLRDEAPKQAEHLLHSVSAFYLSDGRPFKNAEEFLTYALDED